MSNSNGRLRTTALVGALALMVGACASTSNAAPARSRASKTSPPPSAVHVHLDLVDTSRPAVDPISVRSAPTRALPTELYLPAARRPVPLIVFAHGYNGDPSKFTELFQHWSDAGFAVVAPVFPITFTGAADGPISRAIDVAQQPGDLSFVLDHVLRSKWKSRIDVTRIGTAGLSLGGATTWGFIGNTCCRDRRIRAAIVMDGIQFPFKGGKIEPNRIPLLMYHADHDYALPYAAARTAYEKAASPKYFVTIFGAFHAEPYENTPNVADEMVMHTSTLFFRAYLLGDTNARARILSAATIAGISTAESTPNK